MDCLLVTPTSEADLELLMTLFKKMKIKSEVVPAARVVGGGAPRRRKAEATAEVNKVVPRNRVERDLVEAIEEMKEVMAGRKQAISMEDFWKEVRGE